MFWSQQIWNGSTCDTVTYNIRWLRTPCNAKSCLRNADHTGNSFPLTSLFQLRRRLAWTIRLINEFRCKGGQHQGAPNLSVRPTIHEMIQNYIRPNEEKLEITPEPSKAGPP